MTDQDLWFGTSKSYLLKGDVQTSQELWKRALLARDEAMLQMMNLGVPRAQIAQHFGLDKSHCLRRCRMLRGALWPKDPVFSDEELKEAVRLHHSFGLNAKEISKKLNRDYKRTRIQLKNLGIVLQKGRPRAVS